MLFKKKYDDKERECTFCHMQIYPIVEKININLGSMGGLPMSRAGSGLTKEKKYILICPNCKAVIGTK